MKRFRSFVCFTTNAPKKMPGKNAVNDGVLTQLVYPEKGSKRNSRNFDEPVTCENMDISSRKMVSSFVVQSHDNLRADSEDNLSARILEGEAASIQSDIEESEKTMQFSPGRVKRLVQLLQDKESVETRENAASAVASLSKYLRTESLQALVGLLAEKENEVLKRFSVEILSYITEDKNTRNTVCSYPGIIDGLLRLLMASKKNFHRNMVCSYPGITDGLLRLLMASKKNFHNQGPRGDIRVRALLVLRQLSEEDAFAEQFDRIPGSLKTIVDMLADKAFLVQNTASHILENLAANGTEYMQFKIADCADEAISIFTAYNVSHLAAMVAWLLKLYWVPIPVPVITTAD
ncbi:hypothetical protein AXG93_2278s1680 [Marchantia polymorpha subsp. ruderalis]|uniref:Armadillo repeat-containing domain-containing protein n=1 Tax=Marchantia polymorpha subsp. ruderalis TaxID=1480154 RepID=A0A176WG38_MARPO|nr:hypothetical protein AXG93_2278s1680 [Marchantia polymorpha subsp. ruderalis]